MSRRPALFVLCALVAIAGCDPVGPTPRTGTPGPGASAQPGGPSTAPVVTPGTAAERGVIQGRVTTADGRPLAGAQVRVIGYTGSAGQQHDDDLVTDADGRYRVEVEDGLYEVSAEALISFEGQQFRLPLHPVDGACEEEYSSEGIVEDWVLQLTGEHVCLPGFDPNSEDSYYGAQVHLSPDLVQTAPADAVVEVSFVPEILADGTPGFEFTLQRTVAALGTTAGPVGETGTLVGIPLGRYTVSAVLVSGGTRTPLVVQSQDAPAGAATTTLTFRAAEFFPYGIQDQTLWVYAGG